MARLSWTGLVTLQEQLQAKHRFPSPEGRSVQRSTTARDLAGLSRSFYSFCQLDKKGGRKLLFPPQGEEAGDWEEIEFEEEARRETTNNQKMVSGGVPSEGVSDRAEQLQLHPAESRFR